MIGDDIDEDLEEASARGGIGVFAYATSRNATLYVPVMEAVVAARERYRLHVRPAEIAVAVRISEADAGAALDRLVAIGCLTETFDTAKPRRMSDYYRRMSLYETTVQGLAAHRGVREVQASGLRPPGTLQASSLDPILERLRALRVQATQPGGPDAARTAPLLTELRALADEFNDAAQAYMQDLGAGLRAEDGAATDDQFAAYKNAVIAYLTGFIAALDAAQPSLDDVLGDLLPRFDVLATAAAEADAAPDADITAAAKANRARLDGVYGMFVARDGEPAMVQGLRDRMGDAIGLLLEAVSRMVESRSRRANRKADFLSGARWLADCSSDTEAAALFVALFGLHASRHATLASPNPGDRGRPFADAEPVAVAPSLRRRGRINRQGRTGRRADYTAAKATLRRVQHGRERAIVAATARFQGRALRLSDVVADGVLTDEELSILLAALDGATRDRVSLDTPAEVDSIFGLLTVTVYGHGGRRVTVPTTAGTLDSPDWEMHFGGVAATAARNDEEAG